MFVIMLTRLGWRHGEKPGDCVGWDLLSQQKSACPGLVSEDRRIGRSITAVASQSCSRCVPPIRRGFESPPIFLMEPGLGHSAETLSQFYDGQVTSFAIRDTRCPPPREDDCSIPLPYTATEMYFIKHNSTLNHAATTRTQIKQKIKLFVRNFCYN